MARNPPGECDGRFLLARLKTLIINCDCLIESAMESEIKEALTEILEGIEQSDTQRVSKGMVSIESCLQAARSELHPQLVHFLERRSYAKALEFVGGSKDIPHGGGSMGGQEP